MLNPNTRANTVISQSFIASQFQGFNDPFVSSQPTSSLNQFVRSKQTSDSGFIQEGENQSFGFNNITTNHQPTRLQNLSRKTNQTIPVNANMTKQVPQVNQGYQNNTNMQYQNNNNVQYQQQMALNERYISPGIVKTDSPTKFNQFVAQNNSNQFVQQNNNQQSQSSQQVNQSRTQYTNNQQSYQKSINSNVNINSQLNNQQSRSSYQTNQNINSNSRPISTQPLKQSVSGSIIGQRLKLNISQQFSNSFTLNCVTQPQRSNILQMKRRQRQYRKSIQNYFV